MMNLQPLWDAGVSARLPVLIGQGVSGETDRVARSLGLTGPGVAVYDDDAYRRLAGKPHVFRSILFDHEQLFCDRESQHYLSRQCVEEGSWLVAVGGEAVFSIVKLVAREAGMPWLAVPTSAFGLGMASRQAEEISPLGLRRVPGNAPHAILADTTLMSQAEESLALIAVRELIDRTALLARNRAQALAAGYPWPQTLHDCQQRAIDAALGVCNTGLRRHDPDAYARLCEALVICGLAEDAAPLNRENPGRLGFLSEGEA